MRRSMILLGALLATPAIADEVPEPVQGCQDAVSSFATDPERALKDAEYCVDRLRQVAQDAKADALKNEFDGWVGGPVSKEMLMGMSGIKRTYTKDGKTINVQSLGVSDESNPLGALAGLARLGAMSGRRVRIEGRDGSVQSQGNQHTMNMSEPDNSSTIFETNTATVEELIQFGRGYYSE